MHRLRRLWDYLRSTFWFVPSVMVVGSCVLAVGLIAMDSTAVDGWLAQWPRLFGAGPEGSRGMMSTIASSMMTVVGVTFSMILVVLALASSQYTSRVLRNFIRSRVTQFILGTFAGVFTYSLIVVRTIRGGKSGSFVPSMAVFIGFLLASGSASALIFFIHYIATSIQVSSIIDDVSMETMAAVDRIFPNDLEAGPRDDDEPPSPQIPPGRRWWSVPATGNGYIQDVDDAALVRLAREHKTIVRMEQRIGDFAVNDVVLVSVALEEPPDEELICALQSAFSIGRHRTLEQDVAFGVRQIVDIALRALSPGTNDTTTAVMCVDHLMAILSRLASRAIPPSHRCEDGILRVITLGPTFASLVADAFDQIRGSSAGNVGMMLRLLGALETIASRTDSPARRRVLHTQALWISELADRTVEAPHERSLLDAQLTRVFEALEAAYAPMRPCLISTREPSR